MAIGCSFFTYNNTRSRESVRSSHELSESMGSSRQVSEADSMYSALGGIVNSGYESHGHVSLVTSIHLAVGSRGDMHTARGWNKSCGNGQTNDFSAIRFASWERRQEKSEWSVGARSHTTALDSRASIAREGIFMARGIATLIVRPRCPDGFRVHQDENYYS